MTKSFIINKYLAREFLKITLNMSFIFFCLGFIINLFEEINFFKDFDVNINIPIILSLLFVPNLLYNMFPFVVLLSGIWFFLKIKKNDEIIGMKVSGTSNFSIIMVPCLVALFLGIFFIGAFNPISSFLIQKYETIKNNYEKEQDYLAAITKNGIWIKEKNILNSNIIRSENLKGNNLMNITIYQFDNDNNFLKRIEAKSANITTSIWKLKEVRITDKEGKVLLSGIENFSYKSIYNIDKIKSLYSNLDTVSFWNLESEIKLLEDRGYSAREMKTKLQQALAFPLFLLSMVLLSGVFTLGMNFKESNWNYVFVAIVTSVVIFYFNDFSAALGKTEKLPIQISVWMPILIIFIFGAVGVIHANQK